MNPGLQDRVYWLEQLDTIARPVLSTLAARQLKATMPISGPGQDRSPYMHLEAMGRLLSGIAPWLELEGGEEQECVFREEFRLLARESMDAGTDPKSPDYMNFSEGYQPIVDAAFLAHAILRAPDQLWNKLEKRVQLNVVTCLKATHSRKPAYSNWLLFSAIIEVALYRMGEDWDPMRIDYALRQHEQWYLGDGIYGDGPQYHNDYYNSFVIQPMLLDISETMLGLHMEWDLMKPTFITRAKRYASTLERMISPEGSFPPIGRSLAYRFGAFQLLAQMALRNELDEAIKPAQVRCGLTAVMRRTMEIPGTFDDKGWLRVGFSGYQPDIGESYISTGSLYLCAAVFLPLGLAATASFWQGEEAWTAKKAWFGEGFPIDRAL
ncbi:DUF2264 domain-containing protein [Paenibacillus psychroresistens]|uniref:DUF2264 domain-containing protein n=1 Tax=Paenibacillus psychroresistens TaxID=1778678 RepID=A0A6B8RQU5_9BACL|nr:DUF2264 domain-containing protein [Paenibacillus psychroresistens]QGQ98174.1 DUF2264 domain-containing protein [Paenibacillus psychroresistens]